MNKKEFSIEEALSHGWNAMKHYFWLFLACLVVATVIIGLAQALSDAFRETSSGLSGIFGLVVLLANMIITIGFIIIILKILDNSKPEFKDLFGFPGYFVDYLGASVLNGLIVLAGFCLLIVPGIYWAIKFQFFGYCVIDRKLNPVEALRQSARITKTVKWRLLWFGILLSLINLLGIMCLVVGLVVTIPTTLVAYTYVYRKLLNQSDLVETAVRENEIGKKKVSEKNVTKRKTK